MTNQSLRPYQEKCEALALVSAKARWLGDPASEKQLSVLRLRRDAVPTELTKGEASALIGGLPADRLWEGPEIERQETRRCIANQGLRV